MKQYPEIQERIEQHYDEVIEKYPQLEDSVWLIAANGSMNYNMYDPRISDVDSHMIVFPNKFDLYTNQPMFNKEVILENGEHCLVKDIREYFRLFRESNINFMEFLSTDYYFCPLGAEEKIYKEMRGDIGELMLLNKAKTLYSALGMMHNKDDLCFSTYPYSSKPYAHIMRLNKFISDYIKYVKTGIGGNNLIKFVQDDLSSEVMVDIKNGTLRFDEDVAVRNTNKMINDSEKAIKEIVPYIDKGENPMIASAFEMYLYDLMDTHFDNVTY